MSEFDLNIGAKVHCQDGEGGRLTKVVLDPQTSQVSDLIVEKGFLFKKDRVIPIAAVRQATAQDIYLSILSQDLEQYPEYKVIELEEPDHTLRSTSTGTAYGTSAGRVPTIRRQIRQGVEAGAVIISRGTAVRNLEGQIGTVDHLLVDPTTDELTQIVVRQGALFPTHLVIPMTMVRDIGSTGIFLAGSDEELVKMTPYTPRADEAVRAEVQARLEEIPLITDDFSVQVSDGVVTLRGVVTNEADRTTIERLVRQVEGVVEVENGLKIAQTMTRPPDLVAAVVSALATDPRTRDAIMEVADERGTVTLIGVVRNLGTREAAEAVARAQPGVRSVINSLKVKAQ
jgi:osmotically-inducible protein OsmY